jgi:hypothetical protein
LNLFKNTHTLTQPLYLLIPNNGHNTNSQYSDTTNPCHHTNNKIFLPQPPL